MQKVEGSNPFIRSIESPAHAGFLFAPMETDRPPRREKYLRREGWGGL